MRQLIVSLAAVLAATLPAGAFAMPASAVPASTAPLPAAAVPLDGEAPAIVLTSGGCGPYRHRGFNGFCYPGGGFYRPYGAYRPYGVYRPYGGFGYRRYGYY